MHKAIPLISAVCSFLLCGLPGAAQNLSSFTLPTPWSAEALQAEVPLNDYPRPQMVRNEWLCLNGSWQYMGGKDVPDAKDAQSAATFPAKSERIGVPFPP